MYKLAQSCLENIDTLRDEKLKYLVIDFINVTPVDFGVIKNGAFRTAEKQNQLYKNGVSQLDGYKYKSKHQSGLAVDLVPWVDGKYTWDRDTCLYLAGAFRLFCKMHSYPIINGADWNGDGDLKNDSWDPCHFEKV